MIHQAQIKTRIRTFFQCSIITSVLAMALLCLPDMARAQSPTLLGQEKDWAAYKARINGSNACYVLSQPKDQNPKNVRRDAVYFFVTMRPRDDIKNQVSVLIGYPFATGSKASVDVDGRRFTLITKDDKAWIDRLSDQDKLVDLMKAGSKMVVRGRSKRGTDTTDHYSLAGITAALKRAAKACQ